MLAVAPAPQESVLDEHLQAIAEDVGRDPDVSSDLGEPAAAEENLAHDQQRPTLADDLQRCRDRAILICERTVRHQVILTDLIAFR